MKKRVTFDDVEEKKEQFSGSLGELADRYTETHKTDLEKIASERRENLTVRLPESIRDLFVRAAREERYSQSNFLIVLMRAYGLNIPKGAETMDRRRR